LRDTCKADRSKVLEVVDILWVREETSGLIGSGGKEYITCTYQMRGAERQNSRCCILGPFGVLWLWVGAEA
jgi:hypothetical protein